MDEIQQPKRYCEDCKHIILNPDFPPDNESALKFARCGKSPDAQGAIFRPVGRQFDAGPDPFNFCTTSRFGPCGPEAKLFEAKDAPA